MITTDNRKYLILENDSSLSKDFHRFLQDNNRCYHTMYMIDCLTTDELSEQFQRAEILCFEPNLVEFHQYNLLMMLMYDLHTRGLLTIKEIHIYYPDDKIEYKLRSIWDGKRKFLDLMLPHLTIYRIDDYEKELIKINL